MLKSLFKTAKSGQRALAQRPNADLIDVKRLIAELTDEELMRSADQYFAKMSVASEQCWKPFSNPGDAVYLTRHLGLVLEAADLYRGARVLDFGCATGWLTLGLAQMGCDAIGVDISPAALRLAEQMKAARTQPRGGSVEFHAYDGQRLPLEDESVDRIVCFDAFHHVRDQAATLKEFARVLRNGGRAAFMEPGPHHSKTPLSQSEMASFKVIENDVSMPEIARHAEAAGLDKPQMLVQFQRPFTVPVDEFDAWSRDGLPRVQAARMLATLEAQLTDGQCFFIYKGQPTRDSRKAEGLAAELTLRSARRVTLGARSAIQLEVDVRNTGQRDWIAAPGHGQVNLGVHLLTAQGKLVDNNHARIRLPPRPVAPGETVRMSGTVPMPELADFVLRLDMVAEMVTWFADIGGSQPLKLPSSALSDAAAP